MDRIRNHLTSAHVIALLALFVALGGTGYAAINLPKNSVGSKQIKKNAVTGKKVKNRSLRRGDFARGQLPAGPRGLQGQEGQRGPEGFVGAASVVHVTATADLADGTKMSYAAFCPAGQQGIGGGARGDFNQSEGTVVTSSRPAISTANEEAPDTGGTFTGWKATVFNPTGAPTTGIQPEVWVICAKAPTAP